MRYPKPQLREHFATFFSLPNEKSYGFWPTRPLCDGAAAAGLGAGDAADLDAFKWSINLMPMP